MGSLDAAAVSRALFASYGPVPVAPRDQWVAHRASLPLHKRRKLHKRNKGKCLFPPFIHYQGAPPWEEIGRVHMGVFPGRPGGNGLIRTLDGE